MQLVWMDFTGDLREYAALATMIEDGPNPVLGSLDRT
jgi:hypothetical protein